MKKNNAVVFGGTGNQVFAMACVMMDLKRFSPGVVDEAVIFHDGVSLRDRKLLNRIYPTRFIRYRMPRTSRGRMNQGTLNHFSEMVFSKYESFGLLKRYRNVVFTDYDIVIKGDISDLFRPCPEGIKLLTPAQPVQVNLHKPIEEFDMQRDSYSAAFIAVHDNLKDPQTIRRWCYEKTEQYAEHLMLPEQAILNFAIAHFHLSPLHCEVNRYCVHPLDNDNSENASILHAWGGKKFWSGIQNDQWNTNYQTWLDWGGSANRQRRELLTIASLWNGLKNIAKAVLVR